MIPETAPARSPIEAARKVRSADPHPRFLRIAPGCRVLRRHPERRRSLGTRLWRTDVPHAWYSCTCISDSRSSGLPAGLIICCYITGTQLRPEQKLEMIRYLRSRQNGDGGWGLCVRRIGPVQLTSAVTLRRPPASLAPVSIMSHSACSVRLRALRALHCVSYRSSQAFQLPTPTASARVASCSLTAVAPGSLSGVRCGSRASASTRGRASTRSRRSCGACPTGFRSTPAAGGATVGARHFNLFDTGSVHPFLTPLSHSYTLLRASTILIRAHSVVYLPMGYLYGMKATAKETPLIRELREVPSPHPSRST